MRLAAGHKVLDLGCGIGGATFLLADLTGPTGLATGVDVSSALIDIAKRQAANQPGLEFRCGNAHAIPYSNGLFDVAYCERVREADRTIGPRSRAPLTEQCRWPQSNCA
jgi:ubiquinone/menaquinone biosynthesis C-methylase UbiE